MSGSFTLQGRQLCGDDIDLIRQLIAAHPDWHRSRLSVELCRMWDWRTDKGLLKDMACRSMLRKLEQRRLIVLPAERVIGNRARRIREMAHCRDPIVCPLEQLQPIVIVMVTGRGEADDLFHCLSDHSRQGRLKFLANNTRFLILPWVKAANLASFILGACLRRLSGDWITRYGHELFLLNMSGTKMVFAA
jgi:hypothetical protein